MPKIKNEDEKEKKPGYQFPVYSNQELREFEKMVEEKYNGFRTRDDKDRWLMDEGAMSASGAIKVTVLYRDTNGNDVFEQPYKYHICMNKAEQLSDLQAKTTYAKKKELEGLEDLAAGMKFE